MTASVLSFGKKKIDHFHGAWGGQAANEFDPERNRVELLRFTALLLSDTNHTQFTEEEILDCVRRDLNVQLIGDDLGSLISCLGQHPSFKPLESGLFGLA